MADGPGAFADQGAQFLDEVCCLFTYGVEYEFATAVKANPKPIFVQFHGRQSIRSFRQQFKVGPIAEIAVSQFRQVYLLVGIKRLAYVFLRFYPHKNERHRRHASPLPDNIVKLAFIVGDA